MNPCHLLERSEESCFAGIQSESQQNILINEMYRLARSELRGYAN